jgi:hypothetical protein
MEGCSIMTWTWTTALAAGALCGVVALGDAPAQAATHSVPAARFAKTAKATAKQPPKSLRTVKVIVTNSRPATLVELQASVSGSAKMKRVLGFLKPGKQAVAIMPRGEDCHVDLHGAFDDGQTMDSTGVDVCADKTFNLTD